MKAKALPWPHERFNQYRDRLACRAHLFVPLVSHLSLFKLLIETTLRLQNKVVPVVRQTGDRGLAPKLIPVKCSEFQCALASGALVLIAYQMITSYFKGTTDAVAEYCSAVNCVKTTNTF